MSFAGTCVLISGATSGIGAAAARAFAAEGARLVLSGRDAPRAEAIARELRQAGSEVELLLGDIRDTAFCDRLVAAALARFGRLDVLVNSAGIIFHQDAASTSDAQWRETFAVNVDALFFLSRAAVRAMKPRGGGSIVNVASDAGLVGVAGLTAYCASKGAVVLLTKAMAIEQAADGIRVNAICPDEVDTPMLDQEFRQRGLRPEEGRRASAASIPLGRIATPEEVAQSILFVASDKAAFMTGVALALDGGFTAR